MSANGEHVYSSIVQQSIDAWYYKKLFRLNAIEVLQYKMLECKKLYRNILQY